MALYRRVLLFITVGLHFTIFAQDSSQVSDMGPSTPTSSDTIERFIQYLGDALEVSYDIQSKTFDIAGERASKQSAVIDYLPTADLYGSYERNFFANSGVNNGPYNEGNVVLQGIVPLFDFAKIATIKSEKTSYKSSEADLREVTQMSLREFAYAWGTAWEAQELFKLSFDRVEITKNHFEGTKKRVAAGELTKTDQYQADSRYRMVSSSHEQAIYNLYASDVHFRKIFQTVPPDSFWLPIFQVLENLELTEEHPLILGDSLRTLSLKTEMHTKWYTRFPVVSFYASADRKWNTPESTPSGRPNAYDDFEFGLRATMPIIRSGSTITAFNNSKARYYSLIEQSKLRKESVKERCLQADSGVVMAKEVYLRSFEYDSLALKALQGIEKEFRSGMRSSQDVLLAQNDYFLASERRIQAHFRLYQAHIERLYAYGILSLDSIKYHIVNESQNVQ